ncbi:MAG: hypothetical protein JSU73_12905 [candidate division WOR-3 bacterium]|nr:MAG: hypothetical protein JSU73_12905 [candidate division WOR-3 bacterium]
MSRRSSVLLLAILAVGVAAGQDGCLLHDVSADSLSKGMRFTAHLTNRGSVSATFWTKLSIEDSTGSEQYADSMQVVDLAPGSPAEVTFLDIGILRPGTYTARCSVALTGDENPANDTTSLRFVVLYIDVRISAILWPSDTVIEGMEGRPAYGVSNWGAETVDLWAWFSLGYNYAESLFVEGLAGGTNMTMEFPTWRASPSGWIPIACSLLVVSPESLICSPYQGSLYVWPAGAILESWPGGEKLRRQGTVCLGMLLHPGKQEATLLDITGRKVMSLPGAFASGASGAVRRHDIRHIAPGVYFCRPTAGSASSWSADSGKRPAVSVRKVVIQR